MTHCAQDGCERKATSRGLCPAHYIAAYRKGVLPPLRRTANGAGHAFLMAALSATTDRCIEWPFAKLNGYGRCVVAGKGQWAHRHICFAAHGAPSFDHAEAAHSCANRGCVNPRHLRWATHQENMGDWKAHIELGLSAGPVKGEAHGSAKLTESDVRAIRASSARHTELALHYNVHPSTIRLIRTGEKWAHVK